MRVHNIPMDKAELLSVLLEAILYGFSVLMFGGTIWTLVVRKSTNQVNHKMLAVACALLVCSTVHIVIDIIRIMEGFISYQNKHGCSESVTAYFSNVSQWTFVAKNSVYVAHTLIGDGVVLYRCYVAWQSKPVVILPVLLWCAAGAIGFFCCYALSQATQSGVFTGAIWRWITSFWATALTTNLLATLLLIYRIWRVDRKATRLRQHQSQLRPILRTIVDAGAIYSFTLLIALICFAIKSNSQYVVLDMIPPIISITFYMVIIRVGIAVHITSSAVWNTTERSLSTEIKRRTQIHNTTLGESKRDRRQSTLASPASPTRGRDIPNELRVDEEIIDSLNPSATRSLVHELHPSSAV